MRLAGFLAIGLLLGFSSKGAEFVQLTNRTATAISGDGTVFVGVSGAYGFWWKAGHYVDLKVNWYEYPLHQQSVTPVALSMDGHAAVGSTFNNYYSSPPHALNASVLWYNITTTQGEGSWTYGPRNVPVTSSYYFSGISADGNIAVGLEGGLVKRWMLMISGQPADIIGSWANGASISADGNTIAGTSSNQACYWNTNGTVTSLGFLPGASDSTANAISGDGTAIAGVSGGQAFLWTQATGMIGLNDLQGGAVSNTALGVSYDGSVVVGAETTANGQEAFIWDATNGVRNLRTVLQTYGVNLDNSLLSSAVGVSWKADAFCGNGPGGAWYASIARKLQCSANGSNLVFTWSTNEVGFGVEWTSNLSSNSWSWVTNAVIVTNHLNTLSVPKAIAPNRFFRLRKQ